MKKICLLLFVLINTTTAFAQTPQQVGHPPLSDQNAPSFKFMDGETHDFGTIPEGPIIDYNFKFKNIGKQPLIITNVTSSSGSTYAEWPKEPIAPGKTGVINAHMYTLGHYNTPFQRTIYIWSNAASDIARYELYIKGFIATKADSIKH